MLSQLKGSPQLQEFIEWLLLREMEANVFSEGYGENRAFADGKAKEADYIYTVLKGLLNE